MAGAVETQKQNERGRRVVLVPFPFQGHINPMLQLATILHSRGFTITVVHTHFNSPDPTHHPDFNFEPISDGLSNGLAFSEDFIALISALNVNCEAPFRECLVRMTEENPQDPIACIISDTLMYFTQGTANQLKLPTFILWTSSATSFVAFSAFSLLRQKGYLPVQDPLSQALVPELPPLRIKDLPEFNMGAIETLIKLIADVFDGMRISSGVIWNTFDDIEQTALARLQQDLLIPISSIGPLHKYTLVSSSSLQKEDTSCITWLDKQAPRSVIYVSFGSLATMDEKELLETAWGIANSEQPFLWVVRPGSIRGAEWIELLPNGFKEIVNKRGFIVKWAPQQEVLGHTAVGGFWTHNGWNSTLESISEGVPMICRPCVGDQRVNARYVSHVWKVGVQLENGLEREEIERAIRRVMVDKEGEEIRQRAMELKEKASFCLKKGGSSYESLDGLVNRILSF